MQDPKILKYLINTYSNCSRLSLNSPTMVEYWNKNLDNLDMDNAEVLRTIIKSNRYTANNENIKYSYESNHICSAFMKLYKKEPSTVVDQMKYWQYHNVSKDGDRQSITNTVLTPYILLVLFRNLDQINITKRKDFNSCFPGFSTKEGRNKLINIYFPTLKTIIMQPELFDTACLLQAYWNNTHAATSSLEELPIFEF